MVGSSHKLSGTTHLLKYLLHIALVFYELAGIELFKGEVRFFPGIHDYWPAPGSWLF